MSSSTKWYFKKGFIIPFTVGSIPLSYYCFDRYQCRLISQKYLNVAEMYGKVPLAPDHAPLRVTFVAEGRDKEDLIQQYEKFMNIVQPLLTTAGIDYLWLEGSKRKHAIEYVKYWNDQSSDNNNNDLDRNNENSSLSSSTTNASTSSTLNIPNEDAALVLFEGLSEWRTLNWLCKDIDEAVASSSVILHSSRGFLGKLLSVITWPFTFLRSSTSTSSRNISELQSLKSLSPTESSNNNNTDNFSLEKTVDEVKDSLSKKIIPTLLDVSIADKVKKDLLPKETNIYTYQQGVMGVGEDVFTQVVDGVRKAGMRKSGSFEKIFLGHPIRLGLLPLKKSSDKTLSQRIWGFFNKRDEVEACSKAIFGIISESLDMWNLDMDEKIWPSKYSSSEVIKLAYQPYFGTVLYFKPVQVDMSSASPRMPS